LDVGVLCPPSRLPGTLLVTHRFTDAFTIIAPVAQAAEVAALGKTPVRMNWLRSQNWLLIDEHTNTAKQLRSWLARAGLPVQPAMQLDNFDLVINLVSLGMGISMVPVRALAPYNQKQKLIRVPMPQRFTREVVVVVRKQRKMPDHLQRFIENILF
jgi:DNA-binding transcriptional LysR family regulator